MSKSVSDMEKEPKNIDPFGQSRAREGELFVGNFPTEVIHPYRKRGEKYINEEIKRMKES